jgi:hypothetical protein
MSICVYITDGMNGGTKKAEYHRSLEMIESIYKSQGLAMMLYFLYDSQYENKDLKAMAEMALKEENRKNY